MATLMSPYVRWLIRRDLLEVMAIDFLSFHQHWGEDDFLQHLRQRNIIGQVAEGPGYEGDVVAFMVYALRKDSVQVLRAAVHPEYRRQGYGRALLANLTSRLSSRRTQVFIDVPDDMLWAHLWLRACGWRAAPLLGQDMYRFTYRR